MASSARRAITTVVPRSLTWNARGMKRLLFVFAVVSGFLLMTAKPALATMEGHEVSVVNPFANCVGVGADGTGLNYPNTEPEPWVAHNPANPDNYVSGFQQDRWNDGGAKGLVAGWSFNDGHTWGNTALPFSKCADPYYGGTALPYDRASDAWNDIGPDGRTYAVSISFDANDNNNAVGAATSVDGGRTWQNQKPIIADLASDPRQPFNDKESVTADPKIAGTAYAVWDRLVLVACGPAAMTIHNTPNADDRKWRGASQLAAPGSKVAAGDPALLCFEGPATFSKTTDGGVTWSPPRTIVENAPDEQTIANQIVVDHKTGRLYDFYVYIDSQGNATVEDIFSDDGGLTWSPRQTVNKLLSVGIHDPQTGAPARTGDIIPTPAIDPTSGQLYVIWQDGRYNNFGEDDTVISTSLTGITGSWTNPVKVDLPEDRAGFTGAIKVNDLGQVAVDYYSLRHPDLGPDV